MRNLNVAKRHLLTSLKAQDAQTFYDFFEEKYLIMDWKIYTCGNYLNKKQNTVSPGHFLCRL